MGLMLLRLLSSSQPRKYTPTNYRHSKRYNLGIGLAREVFQTPPIRFDSQACIHHPAILPDKPTPYVTQFTKTLSNFYVAEIGRRTRVTICLSSVLYPPGPAFDVHTTLVIARRGKCRSEYWEHRDILRIMSYRLFLDDERLPHQVHWCKLPPGPWTIVRSYDDFVRLLAVAGVPEYVSFDHDLSKEHYDPSTWDDEQYPYKNKTGLDAARYLVEFCRERGSALPEYSVHTMNPVARPRLLAFLTANRDSLDAI